jgi:hypothetical protein
MSTLSPSLRERLGAELAHWANGLDHQNDQLTWWLLRTVETLRPFYNTTRMVHESFQQLRRHITAVLHVSQVQRLDQLLADPRWRTTDLEDLRTGFMKEGLHLRRIGPVPGHWIHWSTYPDCLKEWRLAELDEQGIRVQEY